MSESIPLPPPPLPLPPSLTHCPNTDADANAGAVSDSEAEADGTRPPTKRAKLHNSSEDPLTTTATTTTATATPTAVFLPTLPTPTLAHTLPNGHSDSNNSNDNGVPSFAHSMPAVEVGTFPYKAITSSEINDKFFSQPSLLSTPCLSRTASSCVEELEIAAKSLFNALDENSDGFMSREEFVTGLMSLKEIDITEIECQRLFLVIDSAKTGVVTYKQFVQEMYRYRWLKSVVKLYDTSTHCSFTMKENYDFTKSTNENYVFQPPPDAGDDFQEFFGTFADIRATRDYKWHGNYTKERQLWQDRAVKNCVGKTEPQARPWIVYSCGPMGVGKGHVLSWLSTQGLFPLEFIVHIDPDFFKRIMPEWDYYISKGEEEAGSMCHLESSFMQEIAQEVAMRQRQNVWVDGSLSDGEWFSTVFQDIRRRYPHYRIAIIHITASESTIRERIARRSAATGRSIPESQIQRSLECPEKSIGILASQCDLVVRIVNESSIILKSVEDYSGNWRGGLERHFGSMSYQPPVFPASLGPLYLEKTSLLGHPFIAASDEVTDPLALQNFTLCHTMACIASPYLRKFLEFASQKACTGCCLLTMTPKFSMVYPHDLQDQAGVPEGTSHYRFVFPTSYFRDVYSIFVHQHEHPEKGQESADIESVDWTDPDILFLSKGGFVYFNEKDDVLGVLALSTQPTRFFFQYHNPKHLDARDAERLNALGRWRPITKLDLKAKGAKYFTYIYPKEKLITGLFSEHGTFAYLFREPDEPSHSLDRYFTPMMKY